MRQVVTIEGITVVITNIITSIPPPPAYQDGHSHQGLAGGVVGSVWAMNSAIAIP
jgi:predicted membrane protein